MKKLIEKYNKIKKFIRLAVFQRLLYEVFL
jgi:hypothetical protein